MVNASKHRKTNENPFVDFLKHIDETDDIITFDMMSRVEKQEDSPVILIDKDRNVNIHNGMILLNNPAYHKAGSIMTTLGELYSNIGAINLLVMSDFVSCPMKFSIPFNSKKEAYEIISDFDSSKDELEYKNKIINMVERAGLSNEQIPNFYEKIEVEF